MALSNDLEAWSYSSVGRALTYNVRCCEFESRSGRLFSRTFNFISSKFCCLHKTFLNSIQSMGLRWLPWCEQSSLNSRSNAHCDGAAMAPLCKFVTRGVVRANDLPLSNDLEAWPDSSVGRALTYNVRGRELESR